MEAEDLLLKCHSIFIIPQEQNYYIHSGLSWWVGASHIIIVISPLIWCVSASQTSSMVTQATVTWYTPGLPNEKKVYANATRCERSEHIFKSSQLFLQKLSIWKNILLFFFPLCHSYRRNKSITEHLCSQMFRTSNKYESNLKNWTISNQFRLRRELI